MAARRGVWALARFLHRNQLPGEKEKNALAGCPSRPVVPKVHIANALRPRDKAFFPFSPASRAHGAQKRAKAHARKSISRQTTGFLHTLRLSSLCPPRPQVRSLVRSEATPNYSLSWSALFILTPPRLTVPSEDAARLELMNIS